ncbi:MAG: hypothetical protein IGS48_00950 [Oscillatoriales cyanobacterium C42_A2020_001]|nr:hypothetical protein [Leptolyngbyaceae cyanobacterium C42_A2020_001]
MVTASTVRLTIALIDAELDDEEKDRVVRQLLTEFQELDEVERAERVLDPAPPEGNKALGGFLVNLLLLEVNPANVKRLFGFVSDRLGGKPIELEVEANGKKLKVKASSQEELAAAIKAAQEFVAT